MAKVIVRAGKRITTKSLFLRTYLTEILLSVNLLATSILLLKVFNVIS